MDEDEDEDEDSRGEGGDCGGGQRRLFTSAENVVKQPWRNFFCVVNSSVYIHTPSGRRESRIGVGNRWI